MNANVHTQKNEIKIIIEWNKSAGHRGTQHKKNE
jgi:hypothetical protein